MPGGKVGVLGAPVVHGWTGTPIYNVWKGMRQRCNDPRCKSWKNYGGRGIIVCSRWNDFQMFIEDMGSGYQPGLTIERRDNDGDYEPGNCCWILRAQQNKNRRARQGTVEKAERIAEMRAAGHSYESIARTLHTSFGTIQRVIAGKVLPL